ncbi:uncharacterized protein [Rutidosis leptorrhynchoides]|uniref:uncharacterized protein isoform X3 n=1 Tax=Rutidosis leptorrhynchoides TaxID=125765 RepID=UPI003A99363D
MTVVLCTFWADVVSPATDSSCLQLPTIAAEGVITYYSDVGECECVCSFCGAVFLVRRTIMIFFKFMSLLKSYVGGFFNLSATGRADVVARVFHMKVKEFVSLLKEEPLIITKLGSRGRRFFLPELPKL